LVIQEVGRRTNLSEEDLQYYAGILAPIVNTNKHSADFSVRERWTLLCGFFRYGKEQQPLLDALFRRNVKRMSDYTLSEMKNGLESQASQIRGPSSLQEDDSDDDDDDEDEEKGSRDKKMKVKSVSPSSDFLIQSVHDIVSQFGTHVHPNMVSVWITTEKSCDFASMLLLWAIQASTSNGNHFLISHLIDNHNVTWTDSFDLSSRDEKSSKSRSKSGGGGSGPDSKAHSYTQSILSVWFNIIPSALQRDPSYWKEHLPILTHIMKTEGVRLPDAKTYPAHWDRIIMAFESDKPTLWEILYLRRVPFATIPQKFQAFYRKHAFDTAVLHRIDVPEFERLVDIGIYPNDTLIQIHDETGRGSKIREQYLNAITPGQTVLFRKFLHGTDEDMHKALLDAHVKQREQYMAGIAAWKKSKSKNRSGDEDEED
jgi:hypothetical protein